MSRTYHCEIQLEESDGVLYQLAVAAKKIFDSSTEEEQEKITRQCALVNGESLPLTEVFVLSKEGEIDMEEEVTETLMRSYLRVIQVTGFNMKHLEKAAENWATLAHMASLIHGKRVMSTEALVKKILEMPILMACNVFETLSYTVVES